MKELVKNKRVIYPVVILFIVTIIIVLRLSINKAEEDLWNYLNDTTWIDDSTFAGDTYVFYEDNEGLRRCIHQVHGSGVDIIEREYVEIEVINPDKLKINDELYEHKNDEFKSGDNVIRKFSDEPIVYNRIGRLDMSIVKSSEFEVDNIDKSYD